MRTAAAACAAALVVAGCGGGKTAGLGLSSCTIGGSPGIHAQCGDLRVPENPFDPKGREIPIHVAVVRATQPNPKPDAVFDFAGWGSAGVEDDTALVSELADVNLDHDLVFIDRRGTGGSNELLCNATSAVSSTAEVTRLARACASKVGPNIRYYTTAVAVDDYDRVRAALGYDKIDVYGGSYGVTLGLAYLQRHGSHVRAMVLDSGSLLDVHIFERIAPNAQRALDALFARCSADAACHDAFPKLRSEWRRLLARVARSPITIPDTAVALDQAGLASAIETLIAFDKPQIPRVIHLAATGRLARAASIVSPFLSAPNEPQLAYMVAIECTEPWASRRPAEMARLSRGTFMESAAVRTAAQMAAACKGFPRGYAPPEIGQRFHSNVPILFLQGSEDPADPPSAVAHAQRDFPNSRVVVFPFSGHGQIGYQCAQHLVARFIAGDDLVRLDTTCANSSAIVPFDTTR